MKISSTWAEIDLSAIVWNVTLVRKLSNTLIMAVVKADAYGHGAIEVSRAALRAGANWLGVARVFEGSALVMNGITAPILVLGPVSLPEVDEAIRNNLVLTVYSADVWNLIVQRSNTLGRQVSVHLKIDTGMGRLGLLAQELPSFLYNVNQAKYIRIDGVYTHLAKAGDISFTKVQLNRFNIALQFLRESGISPLLIHVANSTGTLIDPNLHYDMVRIGAALYGLQPTPDIKLPFNLRPALSWKTQIASCKIIPPNWGVSYGHEYLNQGKELVGVIPIGYADGWRRLPGNVALVNGVRVPVIGRICMDMCMLHLPAEYSPGSEVVLLGKQGNDVICAEEVASRWNTSSLDVVSTIANRIPRSFVWT